MDFEAEVVKRLDAIVSLLQSTAESRSSVEVKTSARGADIAAKSYADGRIETAGTEAVDEYLRSVRRLNDAGVAAFDRTVKALR